MTDTDWQTNLVSKGATFRDGAAMHYGNAKAELISTAKENVLCDLSHLGLLEVSGLDATSFLQGQVTNDVKLLNGSNAHYSAYCTPKGRVLALFLMYQRLDNLYLQFNRNMLDTIIKRLKIYVMRSKVDIKDVSDEILKFGLNGPQAASILADAFSDLPTQDYQLVHFKNCSILKLPSISQHQRFEILTQSEDALGIWNMLEPHCRLVGKPCWDWIEIHAGIPEITIETQEQFVPQMLNLDILNGISFKKGCYTGQEIVARTHYLGSVKRRTYLTSIATNATPSAGDKIYDADNNEIGQIVRIAPNLENGFDALIEARTEAKQAGNMFWNSNPIDFRTLPYLLETK